MNWNAARIGWAVLSVMSLALGPHAARADESAAARKPNIVLIVADDLGYGDLGCYGSTRNATPFLDRLAREGLRSTDFHSNGPVCSPTRASLMTGRYPQRVGIESPLGPESPGLPRSEITIAERLRDAGYVTGIFGKWHLGPHPIDNPVHHGFHTFHGLLTGDGDYAAHLSRSGTPDWWHDAEPIEEIGYTTDLLTAHAVRFIEQHRDSPFYLYVPHLAIHFPWMKRDDPPSRKLGRSYEDPSKLGPHADVTAIVPQMVAALDEGVGKILDALRAQGLEQQTLVVFTSDNGGYLSYGERHRGEISSNGPFRGQKGDLYEGGHRVPAIVRWPGRVAPGTVTDATQLSMDLFPTFLELAGLEPPPADSPHALDGVSLTSVWFAQQPLLARTLFWRNPNQLAAREGDWKLVERKDQPPELYNLRESAEETHDIAANQPKRVRQMLDQLKIWQHNVDASWSKLREEKNE